MVSRQFQSAILPIALCETGMGWCVNDGHPVVHVGAYLSCPFKVRRIVLKEQYAVWYVLWLNIFK